MLSWFAKTAPIRLKFDVLTIVYTGLAAIGLGATMMASGGLVLTPPVIAAAAVLVLSFVIMRVSRKLICDPYVGSVVAMEALAAGDVRQDVLYTDYRDCIGRMAKAIKVFQSNAAKVQEAAKAQEIVVEALGRGLSELADGNLTETIHAPFPANYDKLRTDFNRATDSLARAMGSVTVATHGINAGANDIRQASDDLSQRTEQQAASLEETSAAMDEITSTVRQTAEGANRANRAVADARIEAQQSGEVVRRAVTAMAGIERASSEISEIISVIDGIAFQTNLLALNAGVEAARAGDAGKGFAVVASEVRALAQRSADAAKDVKSRILASSEQVESGVGLVSETGKALERIIGQITEISTLVETIASSAEKQAIGLQEVNTAVSAMDGVTQQNAAMVEQATAAARSLAVEADGLAREIARFRINNQPEDRFVAPQPSAQPVHQLQQRAAAAGRRIAQTARAVPSSSGNTALAVNGDDWTEF
ncbi:MULTISPECIES: methyl-accepting chemotaxis protein [unclassified Sphingomonas]|uniref:methyl-accepting chemotaxis protein n=1 Tax=Sphingomonas TaxID=13687 RepID=UPI002A6A5EF2|nr:methyl-accepting chemotaxis protein [Sphingomonas sp. CFBP8993]MDY0959590.1 methyl-accepting chemotaxis protein [Sphingomonas sp. CFBP8993]